MYESFQFDYGKLAEQYSSFLFALTGVSITVFAIVLSLVPSQERARGRRPDNVNYRPPLIASLIVAMACCLAGALLMAETAALVAGRPVKVDSASYGAKQFLLASISIYIGAAVIIFALMLLSAEYKRGNREAIGIRRISMCIFIAVAVCGLSWMVLTALIRIPSPDESSVVVLAAGAAGLLGLLLARASNFTKRHYLLPVTFVSIIAFTFISLIRYACSLLVWQGREVQNYDTALFVFSISFSYFTLLISGKRLMVDGGDCRLWPGRCRLLRRRKKGGGRTGRGEAVRPTRPSEVVTAMALPVSNQTARTGVPKILIISSDTGGGHRSAAAAIVAGVQKFFKGDSYAVRVVRSIEDSHQLTAKMVRFYNWMLRNRQQWMKYLYWFVNRFRPETRDFFYRRTIGYTREIFDRWCPHVVVSVHPLTQHAIARLLKELKLADKIPLVTVVTDPCYGFWKGWACDDVTLYLVASEEARQQLIDYGVSPARIKISGMPVHPKFEMPDDRAAQAARSALGLDPQKFTVFVNAGWVGGGNIPEIFRELVRGELDVQAIFLAGRNDELRAEAEALALAAKFPVKVIGYSEQVEQLMQAANVMVSKLGGLTTFEAFACRLPVIADATTPPMPQESGAAALIEKRGAGVLLRRPADIVPVLRRMLEDSRYYASLRAAADGLSVPDSTRRIVEEIAALIPAPTEEEIQPEPRSA